MTPVRKVIAIAVVASCLALVACGDDDDGDETTAASPDTTAEAGGVEEGAEPEEGATAPGDGAASDPRFQLDQVIEIVLTGSESPALICDELVTERYVRQAYGAREGCLAAQQPGALARSVEIEDLDESGDAASAVVIPSGGPYDGIEVEVELVADPARDGAWQLDSLLADIPAGP